MDSAILLLCNVLLALIFLTGTTGNAVVLLIFYRRPALRNRFVVNLLCTNLISTCILLPLVLVDILTDQCVLPYFISEGVAAGVCAASVLAVLLIALDQYCAVVDPLRYHAHISKARSAGLIVTSWCLSCVLAVLRGVSTDGIYRTTYAAMYFAIVFFLPFVSILWIYVCIYSAAHSNSKRTRKTGSGPLPTPSEHESFPEEPGQVTRAPSVRSTMSSLKYRISNASMFRYREETRAARISALVIVMALVCWFPYIAVGLIPQTPRSINCASLTLLVLGALISPCLFAYRNQRIQREALKLLGIHNSRRLPQEQRLLQNHAALDFLSKDGKRRISFLSSCVNVRTGGELATRSEFFTIPESALVVETCRSSFSSGGSTQGTSSTLETD